MDNKDANAFLPTRLENMKATQNLVEKRILAPLIIVKDSEGKGNPLRNKVRKKKRLHQELAKFDDEILSKIPPEKLSQLLENKMEEGDSEAVAASLRNEIKKLVAEEMLKGDGTQKEIVAVTPQTTTTPAQYTQVPLQHAHGNNGQNAQPQAANV